MTPDIPLAILIQETLDCMLIHERSVEFADCMLWSASTNDAGHPQYKPVGRACTLVRRDVYRLSGRELHKRVPIDTRCGEKACINPDHLFESTTSAIALRAGARGAFSSKARCAKIAAAKRSKAKLPGGMETAREIRMSSETGTVLAARHGIDRSLVNRIKRNLAWKDYSNPFAGLMT